MRVCDKSCLGLLVALAFCNFSATSQKVNTNELTAIVVANTLTGRDQPGLSGTKVSKFALGQLVMEFSQSSIREVIGGAGINSCDDYGYYWYQIQSAAGELAWVYGKYVYHVDSDDIDREFYYDGESYFLGSASDYGYGSSDENGLTGCDNTSLIYFYKKDSDRAYPIMVGDGLNSQGWNQFMTAFDSGLLMVMSGEGGSATLVDFEQTQDGYAYLKFQNGYQDGSNESELWVSFDGTTFVVSKHIDSEVEY